MANQTLQNASEALRNMKFSLDNYKQSNNHNKIIHLRNFITTGRSVTFIIQNLKNKVGKDKFNEWYLPWQEKMSGEDVLKSFVALRNEIEKQGKLDTSLSVYIEHLNTNDLQSVMKKPPPFAKSFFVGDQLGGSGWDIDYGNGVTEKIYVELPEDIKIFIDFEINKLSHLKNNKTTFEMLNYYYAFMFTIYTDAQKIFT